MAKKLNEKELVYCSGENKETPHTRVEDANSKVWYRCDSCGQFEYVSVDRSSVESILADSPLPF